MLLAHLLSHLMKLLEDALLLTEFLLIDDPVLLATLLQVLLDMVLL